MKKKIAKKGFTLVELLAAVILLGLLITGVIFAVSKSIKKSKENYYVKQKELITQAGREYFNDNRNVLPAEIEEVKCVKLTTLINNKYIDDSIDFKKENCSVDDAKVCARKVSLTKYSYNTVLTCETQASAEYNSPSIKFENDVSPGANKTQKVKFKIYYTDKTDENKNLPIGSYKYTIYKMKGSTPNTKKDQVVGGTNTYTKVNGTVKELEVPVTELKDPGKYYIVAIAKTKAGKNNIQKSTGEVMSNVIEITVTAECSKDVIYKVNSYENTDEQEKWSSDDLAATLEVSDKILRVDIELKKNGEVVDTTTVTKTGEIVYPIIGEGEFDYTATAYGENNQICVVTAKYKIDKTAPICTVTSDKDTWTNDKQTVTATCSDDASGCTTSTRTEIFTEESNEDYVFDPVTDKAGNVGYCEPIQNKIDKTAPTCTIQAEGTKGLNDWYVSDVNITFASKQDNRTDANRLSYITTDSSTAPVSINNTLDSLKVDSKSKSYYGYVKDEAGNVGKCSNSVTVKRDTAPPICEITATGTKQNDVFESNVNLSATFTDVTSEVYKKGLTTDSTTNYNGTTSLTHTEDTEGTTYYCYVQDNAGLTGDNSATIVKIEAAPTCEIEVTGTLGENDYYTSNVTATLKTSDNVTSYGMSSINSVDYNNKASESITADTDGVTYYGFVKTSNGTTGKCTSKVIRKYTVEPSCTIDVTEGTLGDNDYYTDNVKLTLNPSANTYAYDLTTSQTATYNGILTKNITSDTEGVTYHGYVKNIAGTSNTCSKTIKRYAFEPSCSITPSGTQGLNGWYTSDVNLTLNTSDNTDTYGFSKSSTATYDSPGKTLTETVGSGTTGVTYRGYVKTKSGVTSSCNRTIKIDVPPTCSITENGTKVGEYYTTPVDLTGTFTKGKSNISGKDLTTSETPSYTGTTATTQVEDTEGTTYYCYVKSQSGLTGTNSVRIKKKSDDVSCSIQTIGTLGDNNWYISPVVVRLNKSSNVTEYGMSTSNTVNYNSTTSGTITADTDGVTYYGFVKGADGKTATCSKTIKKYTQEPSCSIAVTDGTLGDNDYYTTNVKLTMTKSSDTTSFGFTDDDEPSYNSSQTTITHTANTEGTSYYGYVKNKAGITSSCGPVTIKKYSTVPTCSIAASGTKGLNDWYITDVTLTLNTSNATSYGLTISPTSVYDSTSKTATIDTDTKGITYYGYVKSKAGVTNSCGPVTIKRDATPPACNFGVTEGTLGKNNWYITKPTLGFTNVSDPISGLATNAYSISTTSTKNYSTTSSTTVSDTTGKTYYGYVKNGAGLEKACGSPNVKVDTTPPMISVKATRCSGEIAGSSGSSGSAGLTDDNNCTYTYAETGAVDSDGIIYSGGTASSGRVLTSGSISHKTWNPAEVKYKYNITETNFDTAVWQENNSGTYNTTLSLNSTKTNITSSGTRYLTAAGRRMGKITTSDKAGNTSTMTMYAYIAGNIKLKFDVNNGSAWTASSCASWIYLSSDKSCSKSVTYGYKYGSMPTPVRTGYAFNGWYTSASGGTRVTSNTVMNSLSTVTVYAHWTKIGYTCKPKVDSWNSTNGDITLTATSASKLEYQRVGVDSSFLQLSSSSTNSSTSGLKHYKYKYRIATANTGECTSKYDNLKPYAPLTLNFASDNQYTAIASEPSCYVSGNLTYEYLDEDQWDTRARTCTAIFNVKPDYNGDYHGKVIFDMNFGDQDSTNASGSSGRNKFTSKFYYDDGHTCTETFDGDWKRTSSNSCIHEEWWKAEFNSEDYVGNKSETTTVIIKFNYK